MIDPTTTAYTGLFYGIDGAASNGMNADNHLLEEELAPGAVFKNVHGTVDVAALLSNLE